MLRTVFLALLIFLTAMSSLAESPEFAWSLDLNGRYESNDAPTGNAARDQDFDFSHLRARLGFDVRWPKWTVHAVVQAAGSFDLPTNGSFGIGPVYLAANGGDESPSDVSILELGATYRDERLSFTLGRQKWADGVEVMPGVSYLDGVKKARLGERLIGNWDWVNVGRRFDGATFGVGWEALHLSGFAFRPLAAGVNYADDLATLDDIDVYGLTLTGRYGQTLKKAEWRLFAIEYDDERPAALAATGGAIDIQTLGASLLAGGERGDVLLWLAFQTGDWGAEDHQAWAYIAEAGRVLLDRQGLTISGRVGLAEASGDDDPTRGDHETFFNLLPTNHKWYGAIDYSAFQNLRDIYLDATLTRGRLMLNLGLHRFELPEEADAWYGGSGAFNEAALGFAARRPAGGRFSDDVLGHEIDLKASWRFSSGLVLSGGVSYFEADDAGEEVLTLDGDGTWRYLQLSWKL